MQVRIVIAFSLFAFFHCASVKYNQHVAPDGTNGYLRTYYSTAKSDSNKRTDGTGIEQCKVQGSDVICKDLNVIHADDEAVVPSSAVVAKPAPAPAAPIKK